MDLYVSYDSVLPATITWDGAGTTNANASSFTFATVPISTAATNRTVVVGVTYNSATAVTAVTIAGTAANQVASNGTCSFWLASIPTGTTATIVVTTAANIVGCAICVWSAYGLRTLTAVGSGQATSNAGTHTLDATAFQGGVVVGVTAHTTAVASTASWAGLTMDQAAIGIGFGVGQSISAASSQVVSGGSPMAMSVTWTASNPTRSLTAALF